MVLSYFAFEMFVPAQTGNAKSEIEIPRGSTFRQAVDILYDQKGQEHIPALRETDRSRQEDPGRILLNMEQHDSF